MLTLLVLQGPDKGRRYELPDAPALVGRESRSLPLSDNTVSRRHCELLPADGEWIVRDLGSSNGTYLNGGRVMSSSPLKIGDQIRVGRTLMVFGAQPGITRMSSGNVRLEGVESGMDSAIMHTVQSSDDSLVLADARARRGGDGQSQQDSLPVIGNIRIQLRCRSGRRNRDGPGLRAREGRPRHHHAPQPRNRRSDPKGGKAFAREEQDRLSDPSETASSRGPDTIQASRTIGEITCWNTGEGVLSSNAKWPTSVSARARASITWEFARPCVCRLRRCKLTDKDGDEIIGVIYIDSSVKNYTYAPDQLRLLTAIGLQAGLAIQNAKLYQAGVQAERLAAIGETTAALSHSIKNILQALRGGADVVEMGLRGTNLPQAAKGWRIVDRNLDKIYNLTLNLLAYSRPLASRSWRW